MTPFHLAVAVTDLTSARAFYGGVLGCPEGRRADTWVDFSFFGPQLSLHVVATGDDTTACATVDGLSVPIPHFGCVLEWDVFQSLASRLSAAAVAFVIKPKVRFENQPGEQVTMFVRDPSGNALEFKTFRNPRAMLATSGTTHGRFDDSPAP